MHKALDKTGAVLGPLFAYALISRLGDHAPTYLLMSLGFAFATTKSQVIALFIVYGVFHSIDEAQSKAFIADVELERRASAIGVYNLLTGLIYVPASLGAGALWLISP